MPPSDFYCRGWSKTPAREGSFETSETSVGSRVLLHGAERLRGLCDQDQVSSAKLKGWKTYYSVFPDQAMTFAGRREAAACYRKLERAARGHTYAQNLSSYGYEQPKQTKRKGKAA
jgi:hypothetical protein